MLGVIPARYGSTRFPGKPLALISGQPMIRLVYQRCRRSRLLDRLVVATDDRRIYDCVLGFGGQAVLTSNRHRSGSDRVAEVARRPDFRSFGIVLNIQGDEPLIIPSAIDRLVRAMIADRRQQMATLGTRFSDLAEARSPHTAKVTVNRNGQALYFSRHPIPFVRDGRAKPGQHYIKHVGIYAFRRDFLLRFAHSLPGRLEKLENLEQLRALEMGEQIRVVMTRYSRPAVDCPSDVARVEGYQAGVRPAKVAGSDKNLDFGRIKG